MDRLHFVTGRLVSAVVRTCLFLSTLSAVVSGQERPVAPDLLQQFENTKVFWQQFEVAKALVAAQDRGILPKLESWLTADDRLQRGNAAFVFSSLGDPRGFETIVAILKDRSDRHPGQGAVYFHTGPVVPELEMKRAVAAEIRQDRYYAAHLLGDLKDPRAVPILLPFLEDPDINYIVPWSLGQIGDKAAVQPLIRVLSDQNPSMRVLAIHALVELRATEAVPRLRELQNDGEHANFGEMESVAHAALTALAKLQNSPGR